MSHAGGMYPRGNSRSATATPTGSPKRRLPQIPGQGPPPNRASRLGQVATSVAGVPASGAGMFPHPTATSLTRDPTLTTSYDGGLNGRGVGLGHPSARSRSMGYSSGYGGYSDTELIMAAGPTQGYYDNRGYGPSAHVGGDPFYENMGGVGHGGMGIPTATSMGSAYPMDDRRAQPPPPPPRNVNFEGDPPTRGSGGPRGAPTVGGHFESDMISVTSALSSHSAPLQQRPRRPG